MEGISDGRAVDNCFYCVFIAPELSRGGCPRCANVMRYVTAAVVDERQLESRLSTLVAVYRECGDRARVVALENLLEAIHCAEPIAAEMLDRIQEFPSLDELRVAYRAATLGD